MSLLLPSLTLSWTLLFAPSCGAFQEEGPPQPLSVDERRAILHRLVELESLRAEVAVYADYVARERALAEREAKNSDRALELERQQTDLVRKELELEKERSAFYKAAWEALSKGRSKKCTLLKVLTLWIYPCH